MEILLWREGNGVEREIESSPSLTDGLDHGVKLARLLHIAGQKDRRLELSRERLHIRLRLVVEIGNGELGTERARNA